MVRPDLHLPPAFVAWMAPFLAAFCQRSRDTAAALAVGALLAIGPRTVTNCLRALGLAEHPGFTAFHRLLNRNVWSGLALGRTLLRLLVPSFAPQIAACRQAAQSVGSGSSHRRSAHDTPGFHE